ncbi:MAG: SpoIIE family protein phosphatase [Candidatus Riflebacteria bacterium]|nr:SpoIIE family protein phosphatase [Candidatus Riflebacteria bacterium]
MTWKNRFLILLFLSFPFLLINLGKILLFPDKTEELKEIVENRFEEAVSQIDSQKDFQTYFDRFFKNFEQKVFQNENPQKNFHKFLPILKRQFPRMIQTIFLDSSGLPVEQLSDLHPSNYLSQKFFSAYREFLELEKPLSQTILGFLHSLLGNYFPTENTFYSKLFMGSGFPHPVYFYISQPFPQGLFIIFFRPNHHPRELALNKVISKVNKMFPDFRFSLAFTGQKANQILQRLHAPDNIATSFWKKLQSAPIGCFWFENTFLGKRILFPSVWIVGMKIVDLPGSFFSNKDFFALGIQFLVCNFLIMTFLENRWKNSHFFSIRWKLFLVFLFSSFIPLLIMGSSVQSFIQEHRNVLEKETHEKVEKSLLAFDREFGNYLTRLDWKFEQIFLDQKDQKAMTVKEFMSQTETLRKLWNFDLCWIVDSKGEIVFKLNPNNPKIFLGSVGRIVQFGIKDTISTVNSRASYLSNCMKANKTSLPLKPKSYSTPVPMRCMGHIKRVVLGNEKIYFITAPIDTGEDQISHFVVLVWRPSNLQWNYLRKQFTGFLRKINLGHGIAWDNDNPEIVFPGKFKKESAIYNTLVKSASYGFRKVSISGENRKILTGLKGSNLDTISFLIQTSDHEIDQEISDWKWKFRFMAFTIIGLCIVIGFSITRLFLEPVDNLTQGIKAISERNFGFQVIIGAHDELGNLGTLFNEAMSDLADLEVAKIVQENFFPSNPLITDQWEIYGSCISASHVGGDYFDYFQIDENRAICIIGDVSGHGVGAALVVAMAKGIISHPDIKCDPAEILKQLNGILLAVLKKKKMMTCCVTLIDFKNCSMILANAGHPYPILIQNGSPTFIEGTGFPLGSRSKSLIIPNRTFSFPKGSSLIFYSDGVVEALDNIGVPLGYDRLIEEICSLQKNSVVETELEIRNWHRKIARKSPPDDDISLLLVQNKLQEKKCT